MANLNKVILMGYLTADPELKTTPNGVSVTSFSIGVTRKYTKQGEQPTTDFINIVAWRTTAEFISKYFKKGQAICICGSIQTRSYTANDGTKRYATEVVADEATFVEKKASASDNSAQGGYNPSTEPATPNWEEVADDEGLPF
jgi:single-strand DNA-binding protein